MEYTFPYRRNDDATLMVEVHYLVGNTLVFMRLVLGCSLIKHMVLILAHFLNSPFQNGGHIIRCNNNGDKEVWVSVAPFHQLSSTKLNFFNNNKFVIILAIIFGLCLGICHAGSAESGSGRTKFGLYVVRSPETTIAPTGDEVVLECVLSVAPDRIMWRFLPQNASKENRRNLRTIESSTVSAKQ